MSRYAQLKELALANIEALFDSWSLQYTKINDSEYDFINPTRGDTNHGACRFNTSKGRGADFTGSNYTKFEFSSFGPGFTREDFSGLGANKEISWGFDIISLCQRLNGCSTYSDAARILQSQLSNIKKNGGEFIKPARDAHLIREHKQQEQKLKILQIVEKTWKLAQPFEGTIGDSYLRSRNIFIKDEPNVKFISKLYNKELGQTVPALIFRVSETHDGPITAIHRIYLSQKGEKLDVTTPKAALGSISGCAIWFGKPCAQLSIVEGPENALSIRNLGRLSVVSTINSNNFSTLNLSGYDITLFPDPDEAGKINTLKAVDRYKKQSNSVKIIFPPKRKLSNGKLADWNDVLMGRGDKVK